MESVTQVETNEGIEVREVPDCPLCGEGGGVLYSGLRDRYFGAPGRWSILRCPNCGHGWLNPSPALGDAKKLYAAYFTHEGTSGDRERIPWDSADRGVLWALGYGEATRSPRERQLGGLLTFFTPLREVFEGAVMSLRGPARGRLLEIGCGDGSFLRLMRSLGWRVAGLEPDTRAAQMARESHGLDVVEGTVEGTLLPEEAFDAIAIRHVIEHVAEPVRMLERIRPSLKPGGRLVVRTPNLDGWGHRVFRDSWMHLDPPRHLHLFTPQSLRTCVERAGLAVQDLHTSARSAQAVFDLSRSIRGTGGSDFRRSKPRRSLRSHIFLLEEMMICMVNVDAGDEIVLAATPGAS